MNQELNHYLNGIENTPTTSNLLPNGGFNFNQQDRQEIINFLNTHLNNPDYTDAN
ncbi:MAG: hypothetical protein P8M19_04825 [Crocinitomicaceae bacterium]|nr:hypothetical protein [Crocinitomicaceae bacterium]MDG1659570.1 hypothetical protein [Crocinitomicaceae bacterium]MDG2440975.1 hypothetical protein [Crocinitomicaceae bacterium]